MSAWHIREAVPTDAREMVDLIMGLAEYERLADEANPDPEMLREHLSEGATPRCEALIAVDSDSGEALGFALFFPNYSTFLTGWGIYLEDLFVRPEHRGRGIGLALFKAVAAHAVQRGARRLDWSVLSWNEPAIGFYRRLGAQTMDDWRTMRLGADALSALSRY